MSSAQCSPVRLPDASARPGSSGSLPSSSASRTVHPPRSAGLGNGAVPPRFRGICLSGVMFNVGQLSYRQAACPPELLGRMNAAIRWVAWGTLPLGGLLAGLCGSVAGIRSRSRLPFPDTGPPAFWSTSHRCVPRGRPPSLQHVWSCADSDRKCPRTAVHRVSKPALNPVRTGRWPTGTGTARPDGHWASAARERCGSVPGPSNGFPRDIVVSSQPFWVSGVVAAQPPGGQGGQHDRVSAQDRESVRRPPGGRRTASRPPRWSRRRGRQVGTNPLSGRKVGRHERHHEERRGEHRQAGRRSGGAGRAASGR